MNNLYFKKLNNGTLVASFTDEDKHSTWQNIKKQVFFTMRKLIQANKKGHNLWWTDFKKGSNSYDFFMVNSSNGN
jgi:hypothetical protein